jgi:hypothetical protein
MYMFQPGNIKGHDHSGDLDVDGRIILKYISNMVEDIRLDKNNSQEHPLAVF